MVRLYTNADTELRSKMEIYARNNGLNVNEVLKDLHLLEAAFEADEIIVSNESYARRHYSGAARGEVPKIGRIAWVSPCNEAESPLTWLKSGAKAEDHRRLGSDS